MIHHTRFFVRKSTCGVAVICVLAGSLTAGGCSMSGDRGRPSNLYAPKPSPATHYRLGEPRRQTAPYQPVIAPPPRQAVQPAARRWDGTRRRPAYNPAPYRGRMHIVMRGETLYSISRRYGTSLQALARLNGLRSSHLSVGQRLQLPN
ncbi:MAG TPA: LysM peptidoglycan-binding domain-containing protein [Hyphomicrobiaceae bacterium]|nr:LysM peptidoglycan-binding domain-containing protein [Hyphomicrobiaceae bacterium]